MNLKHWFKVIEHKDFPPPIVLFGYAKTKTPLALVEWPKEQCAVFIKAKVNALRNRVTVVPTIQCIVRGIYVPWNNNIICWLTDQVILTPGANELVIEFDPRMLS